MSRKRIAAATAAAGLLVAGFGAQPALADEGGSVQAAAVTPSVTVTGAGSTFQSNIIEQWKADIKKAQDLTINYTGVGSGAGRSQFISNTVDFAGTDVPLTAQETQQAEAARGKFIYIVDNAGGIALEFNLSGVSAIKLSATTIAKIFDGKITNWNDAAIAADNGAALPNKPIQVFVRSDRSGTSQVFTEYLTATAPASWPAGATGTFPTNNGQIGKSGSDGVSNAVQATDGGIGYSEVSFAKERNLGVLRVKNGAGQFSTPDAASVTSAIDDATLNADGTVTLNYTTTNPASYPISTISYLVAPTAMPNDKGDNLKAFLTYILSNDGQAKATPLSYAPLPSRLQAAGQSQILRINPGASLPGATTTSIVAGRVGAAPATTTTTAKAVVKQTSAAASTAAASTAATGTATAAATTAAAAPKTDALARTGSKTGVLVAFGLLLMVAGEIVRRRSRAARR